MDNDNDVDVDPARRPSAPLDRPSRAPFGPRRPKQPHDMPAHADAAVQTPTPPPPPPPPPPTHRPTQKTPAPTFVPPPPLASPPAVSFESVPIPWKGLPLEAAQWTFSSAELQEIVSKAIRLSARDSFVRLLSVQALEVDVVHEYERLDDARLEAQAKWRFEVGRRTMLMHALNAAAAFSPATPGSEPQDGGNPVAAFVGQLASAIAACDSLLSTILQISDQQSQITLLQHQHWASALGVALRKLNKAHERQAEELKQAQVRVQTLEDELEEAWHEAEKMAIEFDDLEQEIAESVSERASLVVEEVPDQGVSPPPPKHDPDETGTLGDVTINTDIAVVLGVTATAVASKATLITSPASPKPADKSDTKSIRSVKSTRSRRSTCDGQSHLARLSSARLRSRAASNASLRLPKALRSAPSTHSSPVDTPPMPALPSPTVSGQSFLDMDHAMPDHVRRTSIPPRRHPEPTIALPTPPHSAGLPGTRVPSIWLETDGGKSTRLSVLDRSHSLQIFSAFTPRKMRRSNLVMSLTGSDRSSDGGTASASPSASGSACPSPVVEIPLGGGLAAGVGVGVGPGIVAGNGNGMETGRGTGTGTASPTSNHSPISLPTHALAHLRGPSLSSSSHSMGATTRPGSAGARLTTAEEITKAPSIESPRKSLVSRASSVLLRRLSRTSTTMGVGSGGGGGGSGSARKGSASGKGLLVSPSKSQRLSVGGRTFVERWKDRAQDSIGEQMCEGESELEGEVMVIGSPDADPFDTL